MKTAVFVTDGHFVTTKAVGGVQRCTQEYIQLFEAAGFNMKIYRVGLSRNLATKIKSKVGAHPYQIYDFRSFAPDLIRHIRETNASVVAINQVNLVGFAPLLRAEFGERLKIVLLSHGNESGDLLHDIVRVRHSKLRRLFDLWRLGYILYQESTAYSRNVDLLLCLSDTDRHINLWLGAENCLTIPRTFQPDFLDWTPAPGRFGFVGTLDHLPNQEGIRQVLHALEARPDSIGVDIRLVGGPESVGRALDSEFRSVTYLGPLSPAELRNEARSWEIVLNPVWWYSRGASTKLAEAVSWGIPIITSLPGRRGYLWEQGDIMTVQSPDEMVEVAIEASLHRERLEAMAEEVRAVANSGPTLPQLAASLQPYLH